jgi:hypothetical protein
LQIAVCWDSPAEAALSRDTTLPRAISVVFALEKTPRGVSIHFGTCPKEAPATACFGLPGGIACHLAVFTRLKRAASWLAAHYLDAQKPDYESFRLSQPGFILRAFQYADADFADAAVDDVGAAQNTEATALRDAIVQSAVTALLGHEVAYTTETPSCPISKSSTSETTGLFAHLQKQNLTGAVFAANSPVVDELIADQCGLRHLATLQKVRAAQLGPQHVVIDRLSADVLAFVLDYGWRPFPALPRGRYALYSPDSYLYAPYRAILFSREMHGMDAAPAICGAAAELIVAAVQTTYRAHPGHGSVSDETLAVFPHGVAQSWNGAAWTPQSYSCEGT